MGDYSFAKTRLQWARERHAEARAAAADFKRLANLENPALVHELKRLEAEAARAEADLQEAQELVESAA